MIDILQYSSMNVEQPVLTIAQLHVSNLIVDSNDPTQHFVFSQI